MTVKFAACECAAEEENWEMIDDGTPDTVYRCATCGERHRYAIDPFGALR